MNLFDHGGGARVDRLEHILHRGGDGFRHGVQIGEVIRVEHLPAQDCLAVKTETDEVLLPFIKAFVPTVDIAKGEVTITPPGGLFEEVVED